MSHFTAEEVKAELISQQTEAGFMLDEVYSCSFVEEDVFFAKQYSKDESGLVGDSKQLISRPKLNYSGELIVDLPVLKIVDRNCLLSLPDDVIDEVWEPNLSDDLLEREGIPMPYGANRIVTGSLHTFNYLLDKGICVELPQHQKFVCKSGTYPIGNTEPWSFL